MKADASLHFLYGFRVLFTRPASIFFRKNNFKTGSYGTIYTFKNYFVTVFLVFSNKQYLNRPLINRMSLFLFPIVYLDSQLIKSTIVSSKKKKHNYKLGC